MLFRSDASGRVGIGVSPSELLHVKSTGPMMRFENSTYSQNWRIGSSGGAYFFFNNQTAGTFPLIIQSNGDVNFYGYNSSNVLIAGYGASDSVVRAVNGPLFLEGTGSTYVRATTGNNIYHQVNGSTKMTVYSGGNVNMGSSTNFTQHVENGNNPYFECVNNAGVRTAIGSLNAGEGNIGTTTNHTLNILTNNTSKITVSTAGDLNVKTKFEAYYTTASVASNAGKIGRAHV